ncbi:uncharacterized protein N0V89_004894 [Didymosphaeria variabile]|uniref:Choline monooxygenase, chloroplastic n=1 Tax=Didymosphaeria variabile TaxID=1932322 RepID=A0A9W8XR99_9PLEO|nr:uncharacterized protein N0V89_004894 [Didymosphaeria variabile]KAJ4356857.1 hypothetical protein N0V89_004894 [Didymosphaeria variabile]
MTDDYFYLMRVVPTTSVSVSMQYEVYRHKNATDEAFNDIDNFFKQIEGEDKFLCTNAQKNLIAGGYVSGPLHPHNEKGVLHFQSLVKDILTDHRALERKSGVDIAPARRMPANNKTQEEDVFCASLCDIGGDTKGLVW